MSILVKNTRTFKFGIFGQYRALLIIANSLGMQVFFEVSSTGIISIHTKLFKNKNIEMLSNLNGKRRRHKTGIIAMLSPKTEDPLFGQQCCGDSQETALAHKKNISALPEPVTFHCL